jgi:hypothetical protein
MTRYTPEANAAIEQLQAAGFDYAEADMIYHGDMLGSALGAKTAALITSLREALEQRDDLLIKAEKLRFGPELTVESRGRSQWAVCQPGEVLNASGEWEWEPQPSSRTHEFIARTRFTFAKAVTFAREIANPSRKETI